MQLNFGTTAAGNGSERTAAMGVRAGRKASGRGLGQFDGDTRRQRQMTLASTTEADVRSAAESVAADEAKLRLAGELMWIAGVRSDVRFEKVAALQEAIAKGTYTVSAADLADRLIASMRG